MYEDLPGWRVFFNYLQAMYHSHPVRKDAAGTIESIAEITPEHLYRCYNTFYNLNNMALVLSGKFDVDKVITVCDEMLKPSPLISVKRVFPKEPDTVVRPFIEQKLSVAMPVFQFGYKEDAKKPRKETDMAAMSALLAILASDASPMFRKLLDQGLINETSFSRDYFEGSGYATVMFGGESRDPEAAAELIRSEVARLQKEGITEADFRWAKRSLYGESISALNHAAGIASWVIDFAFKGMELFTYIDALAGLTLPQVRQKLETLRDDRSVLSVIWPI